MIETMVLNVTCNIHCLNRDVYPKIDFIYSIKSQTLLKRMKSTTTSHKSRKCHTIIKKGDDVKNHGRSFH